MILSALADELEAALGSAAQGDALVTRQSFINDLRDLARSLGLLEPGQPVEPQEADFNEGLQASARGLSPEFRDVLREHFGDQIAVD